MLADTITAIATPLGEGGLAVLRVSGPQALAIADRCFVPKGRSAVKPSRAATHTIHYGHIVQGERVLDEVLLSVLRAPRTFTREDVVEISCHGGLLPARLVLDALLHVRPPHAVRLHEVFDALFHIGGGVHMHNARLVPQDRLAAAPEDDDVVARGDALDHGRHDAQVAFVAQLAGGTARRPRLLIQTVPKLGEFRIEPAEE